MTQKLKGSYYRSWTWYPKNEKIRPRKRPIFYVDTKKNHLQSSLYVDTPCRSCGIFGVILTCFLDIWGSKWPQIEILKIYSKFLGNSAPDRPLNKKPKKMKNPSFHFILPRINKIYKLFSNMKLNIFDSVLLACKGLYTKILIYLSITSKHFTSKPYL